MAEARKGAIFLRFFSETLLFCFTLLQRKCWSTYPFIVYCRLSADTFSGFASYTHIAERLHARAAVEDTRTDHGQASGGVLRPAGRFESLREDRTRRHRDRRSHRPLPLPAAVSNLMEICKCSVDSSLSASSTAGSLAHFPGRHRFTSSAGVNVKRALTSYNVSLLFRDEHKRSQ